MRLPGGEIAPGVDEAFEHAYVVGRPHVLRGAADHGAGEAAALEEELPVLGTVEPRRRVYLGLRILPQPEGGHVEVTHLHDVHDEAAAIGEIAPREVDPDHASVLLRGGLDRMHL